MTPLIGIGLSNIVQNRAIWRVSGSLRRHLLSDRS